MLSAFPRFALSALCSLASAQQAAPAKAALPAGVAALGAGVELSMADFHALVLDRHAQGEVGRAALKHLLRARVLERLAGESKLVIEPAEVDARMKALEAEIVAAGQAASLDEYLAKNRIGRARFREFLRLGLVQETLARRALGIPAGRAVNGEQQEMWLDQVIEQRGAQYLAPPWPDGVAARCGDLELRLDDFREHLEQQLTRDDVRDDCFEALLAKCARARMPDLSAEALERALDAECTRRRAALELDPKYKGLSFEQMLAAQGLTLGALRRDPAVLTSALAFVWIDRTFGEEGLKRAYAAERDFFDARFGEARDVRAIFLRGAQFVNELNPRTFDDAERELEQLKRVVRTREDFEKLARQRSEDPATRDKGGALGFIAPGDEHVPEALRAAIFSGPRIESEHVAGPTRIAQPSGVLLLWVGERRPAPGWEEMRARVHNELRRRFIDECLKRTDVVTYLD